MSYIKARFYDTRKIFQVEGVWQKDINKNDLLVVKSEKGDEIAKVIGYSKEPSPAKAMFLRKATEEDIKRHEENEKKAEEAFQYCKNKIQQYGLDMKLIKSYITLDSTRVFFYYTSSQRIDFRNLVKDLAKYLKKRIEMRQIGVRDAIQMMGWIGNCGDVPCCYKFAESFESISLRDIEEQNLPLSPSKFTGPCGRLVCCLGFERDNYIVKNILPEVGTHICYQGQEVKILHIDPLKETVVLDKGDKKEEVKLELILPFGYQNAIKSCKKCSCCRKTQKEDENFAILYE